MTDSVALLVGFAITIASLLMVLALIRRRAYILTAVAGLRPCAIISFVMDQTTDINDAILLLLVMTGIKSFIYLTVIQLVYLYDSFTRCMFYSLGQPS